MVAVIALTACSGSKDPEETPTLSAEEPDPSVTQTVYDLLDALVKKEYASIKIDIAVTTDFAELYSNYVFTQNNVIYCIEKLNLLPSDGNITDLPSNYKTTVTGYALIENGQVVELDGNKDVTLPAYDELKGNFNFDESNFQNAVVGNNSFKAEVVSPTQFYGADVDMSNLEVEVEYTEAALTKIILSYRTTNATVQTVYVFEN